MFTKITCPPDLVLLPSGKILNVANILAVFPHGTEPGKTWVFGPGDNDGLLLDKTDTDALKEFVRKTGATP